VWKSVPTVSRTRAVSSLLVAISFLLRPFSFAVVFPESLAEKSFLF